MSESVSPKYLARLWAGAAGNPPVEIVHGSASPRMEGRGFYFENKSGDVIRHPAAYQRAYGKPIYVRSARRVVVGKRWLARHKGRYYRDSRGNVFVYLGKPLKVFGLTAYRAYLNGVRVYLILNRNKRGWSTHFYRTGMNVTEVQTFLKRNGLNK